MKRWRDYALCDGRNFKQSVNPEKVSRSERRFARGSDAVVFGGFERGLRARSLS